MHAASKVINPLILLNCNQARGRIERPWTCDIAAMLCMSERKVDRIKKKFVLESLALTLNRQPSKCEYDLLIDGSLEAQLLTLSRSAGRVAIREQCLAGDGAPGAENNKLKP